MTHQELLLAYIDHLFTKIRGDWSDPREGCREGWEAVARLTGVLGYVEGTSYRHRKGETDEHYFQRIRKEMRA